MPAIDPGKPRIEAMRDGDRRIIIRTVNLKKRYVMKGIVTEALRGVNVEMATGELIVVMGPSGSGKSTFFNMVGGLDSPTSGRVFIDEVDVAALENVTTPMIFAGVGPDEARERGMSLLELVGLKDRWFHRPIEMSGGQQQRVAIARALANQPAILLCDEPTANLDHKTGMEILRTLQRLNKERGVTIICATHDHRMMDMCDRLLWIRDGRIERVARRDEVHVSIGSIDGK